MQRGKAGAPFAVEESPKSPKSPKSQESKRAKKGTKKKKPEKDSKREGRKKKRTRRRTIRNREKKSVEEEVKTLSPTLPKPEDGTCSPRSKQDQLNKRARTKREHFALNKFMSKPPSIDASHVPLGAVIETEKLKYKVLKRIGAGGCGETFVVQNMLTRRELCAKVEFLNKEDQRLRREFDIYREIDKIKRLAKNALPHLLQCYDFGEVSSKIHFMFLPLCKNSLEGLMKQGSPTLATSFEMTLQVLAGIEELHSIGYIHRDLKPANIVVNEDNTRAFIIDFGMSCKFITELEKMPESSVYDFIGTTKYAPRDAHKGLPQSRRSDMEAWLYVILELFVYDILPWRDVNKNKEVVEIKELFFSSCYARKIAQAPSCFINIISIIQSITVVGRPDYNRIASLIQKEAESRKITSKQKFKFDSTPLALDIELWKTGQEIDPTSVASGEEIKMDLCLKKSPKASQTKSDKTNDMEKPPSTTSSTDGKEKEPDEYATLHSGMKCKVTVPSTNGSNDDDDEAKKGSDKQNRL